MGQSAVSDRLTFLVEGLSGTCVLRLTGSLPGWYLKSAMYRGVDLLDKPTTFEAGQLLNGIEVVLSDRRSELFVSATDEHGALRRMIT